MFGGIHVVGNMLIIVELENTKVYHAFTYRGAAISDIQYLDDKGNLVRNPQGMSVNFVGSYFIPTGEWRVEQGDYGSFIEYLRNHLGGNKEMQKHIIELTRERDDLSIKINRLKKFMQSDEFHNLDKYDQELLKAQKSVMKTYKHILNDRIYWED